MTGVLIRRPFWRWKQRLEWWVSHPESSRASWKPLKVRREAWSRCSLSAFRGRWPCWHLASMLLVSICIVRGYISVVLSHQVYGNLWQPWDNNTLPHHSPIRHLSARWLTALFRPMRSLLLAQRHQHQLSSTCFSGVWAHLWNPSSSRHIS